MFIIMWLVIKKWQVFSVKLCQPVCIKYCSLRSTRQYIRLSKTKAIQLNSVNSATIPILQEDRYIFLGHLIDNKFCSYRDGGGGRGAIPARNTFRLTFCGS